MLRRQFFQWLTFAISALSFRRATAADPLPGSLTPMPGVTAADLEQTLKSGLKARRPVEFEFISVVVLKVKNNELPLDLVQSTFLWARRQKPYQYPYFERALRERATKLGYTVPVGAGY
jgi:hypothetical protein